jgi:polyhydroxyalkanoate synthesis repressor PhaR
MLSNPDPQAQAPKREAVVIKKYANRRLYNTATSSYVTLENLAAMVKGGAEFVVHDAKTGEDLTRAVLTQIIVELEGKGQNLLPIGFLRQLIGFYGDSLQSLVPSYLDVTMQSFCKNQQQMRDYFKGTLGTIFPFNELEEMGRKNVAMFEQAMKMFTPFYGNSGGARSKPGDPTAAAQARKDEVPRDAALDELKDQVRALREQLNERMPNKKNG